MCLLVNIFAKEHPAFRSVTLSVTKMSLTMCSSSSWKGNMARHIIFIGHPATDENYGIPMAVVALPHSLSSCKNLFYFFVVPSGMCWRGQGPSCTESLGVLIFTCQIPMFLVKEGWRDGETPLLIVILLILALFFKIENV